ncbi:5-oxoprolinase subunit PxpA [Thalassomonas viridans]|uniref:5-oxoprolinase subunit PxpA n=1 Tax=Thalassomonas viridans TaxID=137584 RepID=A0AAF0C9H6_9GAMM|nr:5-oxoprolinase subunit PxpA [Thalassomonas viridans]WDE05773.1 5-oxoprolinase subunit PxpA [Thalassomonas viridans]
MKLNCDLGESFGLWQNGNDEAIMPYIDLANIACGFHASDPLTMLKTVQLAQKHQVTIGAHPGYPDLLGFGRRSMSYPDDELIAILHYQLGALQAICQSQNTRVSYVKPHGALYNDMMKNPALFACICRAIQQIDPALPLMVQALPEPAPYQQIAGQYGIGLWFEAFADRHYLDSGLLVPRSEANAVLHSSEQVVARCRHLKQHGQLLSINEKPLPLQVDTLCIHGDNPAAPDLVRQLSQVLA